MTKETFEDGDTVVVPTCAEYGYILYECACGYSYQENTANMLGHVYDDNLDIICNRCGYDRSDDIVITPPVTPIPPIVAVSLDDGPESSVTERVLVSTVVEEYSYIYNGGSLVQMTVGSDVLYFAYDASGSPMTVTWNGTTYLYVTNIQGDVIAILDTNGASVVEYTYDAWGNILSTSGTMADTLGILNPLTYRGYVYDHETELYYLWTRYYNPEWGRFIISDVFTATGQGMLGNNMFAYCGNNPINRADTLGMFWEEIGDFFADLFDAIVGSFQFEIGGGVGLGVSAAVGPVEVNASAYQDSITMGVKNGDSYTAIKGAAGVSAQITDNLVLGFCGEYEHRFETNSVKYRDEHDTMSMPWNVYKCPHTEKEPFKFNYIFNDPVEGDSSGGLFIGISAEAHFIVGGHITVGWDANKFLEIFLAD